MNKWKNNPYRWDKWSVRFPDKKDQEKLIDLYRRSKSKSKSEYMRKKMLDENFKVEAVDQSFLDIVDVVYKYLAELNKIGVNYNQVTKVLNSPHSPAKGSVMLEKLQKLSEEILRNQKKMLETIEGITKE